METPGMHEGGLACGVVSQGAQGAGLGCPGRATRPAAGVCGGCRVYQVGFAPLPTLRSGPPGAPGGPQGAFAGSVEGWGRVMAENAL